MMMRKAMMMPKVNSRCTLVLAGAMLMLGAGTSGCSSWFSKKEPMDTPVVAGRSLIMPPNYDLRPPRTGGDTEAPLRAAGQPDAATSAPAARELVAGSAANVATVGTQADAVAAEAPKPERGFWQRWFGWTGLAGE